MLKLSFRLQVLLGFLVSIILVLTVGYISHRSIRQLQYNEAFTEHSHLLINTSKDVLQLLTDCETGSRGYLVTNDKEYLQPYYKALPAIAKKRAIFLRLYTIIPSQKKDLVILQHLVDEKLTKVTSIVNAKENSIELQNGRMFEGKRIMDSVRFINARINKREQQALDDRRSFIQNTVGDTLRIIDYGSLVFFFIVVLMLYYIQKTYTRQKLQEEEVKHTNYELAKVLRKNEAKNWLLTGAGILNEKLQGQQTETELSENIVNEVCAYAGALSGTLYLFRKEDNLLELGALYAFHNFTEAKKTIRLSEGWIGQVAKNKKSATIKGNLNTPFNLETSIVNQQLAEVFITPLFFDKKLVGVMEFAFQDAITEATLDYINMVSKDIGIALNTAVARAQMQVLYHETHQQAEELEAQQEEMRLTNEELLSKTEMLQASEEELKVQQEELRTINAELEEKAKLMEVKNRTIEEARLDVSRKVEELEITGRYKSEFLANMSHELRTPLNSILVLARILKDNKAENLSTDQIKYAGVIFNAGNDLLTLINDILDLAKIESGKVELQNERISVEGILADTEMLFSEVALNKQITFTRDANNVPQYIVADKMRVEQIIKNLLSNAFKFTPAAGTVTLTALPGKQAGTIAFTVKDSGIGIPPEKQKLIFEAFQQADGSTSRQYGGTGLGLSISRELAILLGGSLSLNSEPGEGSVFTITIPITAAETNNQPFEEETLSKPAQVTANAIPVLPIVDKAGDGLAPLVVIVEDDQNFADILENYAKEHGYRSVLVNEGTTAVKIITDNMPDAVILDIMLPGKDGWQILKELKQQPETKHIPVHLMSAGEATAKKVKSAGAISFMKKPIKTEAIDKLFGDVIKQTGEKIKHILLVEDHEAQSDALKDLMQKQGITVEQAFTGAQAYELLQKNNFQCVVLDLNLPDIFGLDLLDKIRAEEQFASLPVIINTAMELDKSAISRLMHYSNAMVIKTSKSSDRLIDEVNLFLHKLNTNTPVQANIATGRRSAGVTRQGLKGKTVLLVDDDMRNIFALSTALQSYDLVVEIANDGEEALAKLADNDNIDVVLMDIMMPKMDGYEAMRHIRRQSKWAKLPVIALTAKAMKDDREKCIAAGANDYITKPVDVDRLISLIQLWMEG